eukprot:3495010-Pyramimonas_sp.AAC.1
MAGFADACSKTGGPITGRRSGVHSQCCFFGFARVFSFYRMIKDAPRWPPPKGQCARPSDAKIRPGGCSLSASRLAAREAPLSLRSRASW